VKSGNSRDWLIKIQYITINIDTLRALTCRIRLNVLCPCASRTILKQVQHVKTVFGKNYIHSHANNLIILILDIDLKKRSIDDINTFNNFSFRANMSTA